MAACSADSENSDEDQGTEDNGGGGSLTSSGGTSGDGGSTQGSGGETAGTDCSALPLCTDFESDATGSVPSGFTAQLDYGNNGSASKVAVTEEKAHSGSRSVKVDGSSGLYGLLYTPTSDSFHMRAWLKVEDLSAGNPVIIGVGPDNNSEVRMRLFKTDGSSSHYVLANAAAGDGLSPDPYAAGNCSNCVSLPNEWFCLQMHVDAASKTLQFWVDGTQAVNVQNNAPWHSSGTWPTSVSPVRIGAMELQGGGATVYVDDVAFGSSSIACE